MENFRRTGRDPTRNPPVDPMEAALHSAVSGAISSVISRAGAVGGHLRTGPSAGGSGSDDDFNTPLRRLV